MSVRRLPQLPFARPTIERRYGLMAETLLFQTNDPLLAEAADASFGRYQVPSGDRQPLVVQLFTESVPGLPGLPGPATGRAPAAAASTDVAEHPRMVFRTHGLRLLISRGSTDVAMVEVAEGRALGYVSAATARDQQTVRYSFIEAMGLSLIGPRGYLPMHATGVVRDGVGVILQGPAGAGKSTLAMACARRGYGVFADDSVFARIRRADLEFWGMPWTQRLLPDARVLFPELARFEPRLQPNGESKLEVDLEAVYPGRATACAPAGPVVLLARGTGGTTRIEPVSSAAEAAVEVLWVWDSGWTDEHERGTRMLEQRGVYRLHVNGTPDEAVDAIDELVALMTPAPATP